MGASKSHSTSSANPTARRGRARTRRQAAPPGLHLVRRTPLRPRYGHPPMAGPPTVCPHGLMLPVLKPEGAGSEWTAHERTERAKVSTRFLGCPQRRLKGLQGCGPDTSNGGSPMRIKTAAGARRTRLSVRPRRQRTGRRPILNRPTATRTTSRMT